MVAVMAPEAEVADAIAGHEADVSLAAVNGPESVVVSGRREAVEAALAGLTASGIETRDLVVSHAFHSPLMAPMLDDFEAVAGKVRLCAGEGSAHLQCQRGGGGRRDRNAILLARPCARAGAVHGRHGGG